MTVLDVRGVVQKLDPTKVYTPDHLFVVYTAKGGVTYFADLGVSISPSDGGGGESLDLPPSVV